MNLNDFLYLFYLCYLQNFFLVMVESTFISIISDV